MSAASEHLVPAVGVAAVVAYTPYGRGPKRVEVIPCTITKVARRWVSVDLATDSGSAWAWAVHNARFDLTARTLDGLGLSGETPQGGFVRLYTPDGWVAAEALRAADEAADATLKAHHVSFALGHAWPAEQRRALADAIRAIREPAPAPVPEA